MADDIRIKAPFEEVREGWYRYYAPGCNESRAVQVEMIDERLFVIFTPGMYPTPLRDVPAMGEFAVIDTGPKIVKFSDLTGGDRFKRLDVKDQPVPNEVWTKLYAGTARRHGPEETRWGGLSFGYIGSAVCSFEVDDRVLFIPVPL